MKNGANSYIIVNGRESVVVDTAAPERIAAAQREKNLKLRYIILTHGHLELKEEGSLNQASSLFSGSAQISLLLSGGL